jgi:hypothetical protein
LSVTGPDRTLKSNELVLGTFTLYKEPHPNEIVHLSPSPQFQEAKAIAAFAACFEYIFALRSEVNKDELPE